MFVLCVRMYVCICVCMYEFKSLCMYVYSLYIYIYYITQSAERSGAFNSLHRIRSLNPPGTCVKQYDAISIKRYKNISKSRYGDV